MSIMVKVIRISKEILPNEFKTNKFPHVALIRTRSDRRFTTDDHTRLEVPRRKSWRDKYFISRNVKRHSTNAQSSTNKYKNQIVPNDSQDISLTTSNSRAFEELEGKKQRIWPRWFFWWATCVIILGIGAIITITAVIISQSSGIPKMNWVVNGNAETGSCESSNGVASPTDWNYNGTITQIYYNNTNGDLMYTDPGPSDRGNCYFYGQASAITTMWQTVNIPSSINPFLIDNQKLSYNFSAWIGGYYNQDDNAQVSLTFIDQSNQNVGNTITIGPILAADRGNVTSLLFQQTNGLVPTGARSFMIMATITLASGGNNDGSIDNIAVVLYN